MLKYNTYQNNSGFYEITHTADLGIEVYGNDLPELFKNAIYGMNSLIFGEISVKTSFKVKIRLKENTLEDLLVSFLSEYNFCIQSKNKYIGKIHQLTIDKIDQSHILHFEGDFSPIPKSVLTSLVEIKSITYHQMHIILDDNLYRTKIIFDI